MASGNYHEYNKENVGLHITKYTHKTNGKVLFRIHINNSYINKKEKFNKTVYELRDAQIVVDKYLINKGLEPIYILKKKL